MNKNFVPLKEIPEKYEAYLYLVVFDHDKTKKYYLGYHVGLFDGTYKGTPITHEQEFFEDLGKYDYKIYALDFGNADKMITKEKIMLDDIKKTDEWDEYYNEQTGGGAKLQNYNSAVDEIQDGIEQGIFRTENVDKKTILAWDSKQVRFQYIISSHKTTMKELLEDSDGKWLNEINEETGKPNFRGVLALEDYYGKGQHCKIGSAHTVAASKNVKQITELKVIFIPRKLNKKLSESDIKELGQWDNPQKIDPRIPTPEDEHVEWIVESCLEKNIKPDHYSFERKLLRQNVSKRKISPKIKIAEKWLADLSAFKNGLKQIDWDEGSVTEKQKQKGKTPKIGSRAAELEKKIDSFNGVAWSSSVGSSIKIVQNLIVLLEKYPDETNFLFYAKVPAKLGAKTLKNAWDDREKTWTRKMFKMFMDRMDLDDKGKSQLTIEIEDLEFTEPDPTFVKN